MAAPLRKIVRRFMGLPRQRGAAVSDNIRELAESIIAYTGETPPEEPYDPIVAALGLAEAWLAEHPADDAEPVTEEWLLSIGFTKYVHWPSVETAARELLEWRAAGMWIGETPIALVKCRGDVRRLCAALGVTLKEQP